MKLIKRMQPVEFQEFGNLFQGFGNLFQGFRNLSEPPLSSQGNQTAIFLLMRGTIKE